METDSFRRARIFIAALAALIAMPACPFLINVGLVTVYEYVNDRNGHYFLTVDGQEKAILDAGGAGGGWHPTGHQFGAYYPSLSRGANVCRFYAAGPDAHFFTASTFECDLLRANGWGWAFEGVPFKIDTPVNGACAPGLSPIFRLYNNRSQFNDSSHRYVAETALRDELARQGWSDEGIAFCASYTNYAAPKIFSATFKAMRPVSECQNEDLNLGSCIAMNNLPASLPTRIVDWVAPSYVTRGPQWSQSYYDLTGADGDVYTAQSASDTGAVLAHSFVQEYDFASSDQVGAHVSSLDSAGPLASIEPLYQFSTRAPAAGAADARVFPWRATRENHLDLSFYLTAKTVRRSDPQSHAYGAPMIEFRDVRSGAAIDVTVQTFGTIPPADFVGVMEPATGNVFVSTVFRADPSFGTRVSGDFIACGGAGACASSASDLFQFRVSRDDFAKIIAMARAANPALSQDVNDYLLVNFRFRNGILGNADLGSSLGIFRISLYGY